MSHNFEFLKPVSPTLAQHAGRAEALVLSDPDACMFKLRKLGELMARDLLERWGEGAFGGESQLDRLQRLDLSLPEHISDRMHDLRRQGNRAVHESNFTEREALRQLRSARKVAVWYFGEFGDPDARVPAFVVPTASDPRLRRRVKRALAQEPAAPRRSTGPDVGIYHSLHDAFQALSEEAREVLGPLIQRFREAPDDPQFKLQPFPDGVDDKLGWLRLDEAHALVVVRSPRGDVFLCVWVGPHPDAHAWARSKRFEVHPVLGSLQVFDVEEAEAAAPHPEAGVAAAPGLYATVADEDLLGFGIPAALLVAVRALTTEAELDALAPHLPAESSDALYLLASGTPIEETRAELEQARVSREPVDPEDFSVALSHPDSRRRFQLLSPDTSLGEMLLAPLDAWRVYLHPEQLRLVKRRVNGPTRVLGGAGTGKTVALLHRVLHLAAEVFDAPDDRILVTTYTRTLAAQLRRHVAVMFADAGVDASRVTVDHLHRHALEILRGGGQTVRVIDRQVSDRFWQEAMREERLSLPLAFYQEEWDAVLQPQGVTDRRGYLRARRTGRGTPMNRRRRLDAWAVLGAYRAKLDEGGWQEWPGIVRAARESLEGQPAPYAAVLSDEIQDFGEEELRLLRALAAEGADDLFMVGDTYQRIYGTGTSMIRCGIEIRGRSSRLKVNYRTTERIRDWAVALLQGVSVDDLDENIDVLKGYHSLRLGQPPRQHLLATEAEEAATIAETIEGWLAEPGVEPEHICVAARTRAVIGRLGEHLAQAGIATVTLKDDEDAAAPGVRLSTMHRMKGLEFPRVVLAGFCDGLVPLRRRGAQAVDAASAEDADRRERCLVYVAATRARDELVITGHGRPSPWLSAR